MLKRKLKLNVPKKKNGVKSLHICKEVSTLLLQKLHEACRLYKNLKFLRNQQGVEIQLKWWDNVKLLQYKIDRLDIEAASCRT